MWLINYFNPIISEWGIHLFWIFLSYMINDIQSKSIEIYILYDFIKISSGLWTSIDVHLNTMSTYHLTPECGRPSIKVFHLYFVLTVANMWNVHVCLHMLLPDYPFYTWTEHWTEHLRWVLLFCRWASAGNSLRTDVRQVTHFWATCLTPEVSSTKQVPTSARQLNKFTSITPIILLIYLYSVPVLHLYCVVTDTCTTIFSNCLTPVLLLTY